MRLINADGSAGGAVGQRPARARGHRHPPPRQRLAGGGRCGRSSSPPTRARAPLTLVERSDPRFTFRAGMGQPSDLRHADAGRRRRRRRASRPSPSATRSASCLARCPTTSGSRGSGRRSSATPRSRTAPTSSSPSSRRPTACASGSGSAASGRPSRPAPAHARPRWRPSPTAGRRASLDVVAPGGSQRVEWTDDGPLPDRLGRTAVGRDLACRPLTRPSKPSRATRRRRSGSTAGAAPWAFGSRRPCCCCCSRCRCRCPSPATAWPRSSRSSSCSG